MTFLSIFRMKTTSDMLYIWWLFFLFSGWRLPVTCYIFDDFSFYFQDEDYQWHVIYLMTFLSIFRMKTTSDMLYIWWLFFLFSGWRLPVTCYIFDDFSFYFQDEDYQWHVIYLMTFLSIFRMKTNSDMLYQLFVIKKQAGEHIYLQRWTPKKPW